MGLDGGDDYINTEGKEGKEGKGHPNFDAVFGVRGQVLHFA